MKWIPALLALVILSLVAMQGGTSLASSGSLPLTASATNTTPDFNKYVYSFSLPGAVNFTGLSGSLSISSPVNFFGEALVSVGYYSNGACPPSGSVFPSYDAMSAAYPGSQPLVHYILKQPYSGTTSLPTALTLPVGVPISGCVVVIFDGSNLAGGSFTMSSAMTLKYDTAAPASPSLTSIGDEFCFNMAPGTGCQIAALGYGTFASVTYPAPGVVKAMYGDISDAAYSGAEPFMTGPWSSTNDVYIDAGCSQFGSGGLYGPGSYTKPAGDVSLLHSVQNGSGMVSLQQAVILTPNNAVINAGDCIVHLVHASANGTIDAETQLMLETVPYVATTATPAPTSTPQPWWWCLFNRCR